MQLKRFKKFSSTVFVILAFILGLIFGLLVNYIAENYLFQAREDSIDLRTLRQNIESHEEIAAANIELLNEDGEVVSYRLDSDQGLYPLEVIGEREDLPVSFPIEN